MAMPSPDIIINGLTVAAGGALLVERFIELLQSLRERANHMAIQQQERRDTALQLSSGLHVAEALKHEWVSGTADPVTTLMSVVPETHTASVKPSSLSSDDHDFERHSAITCVPLPDQTASQIRLDAFLKLAPVAMGVVVAGIFELHLLAMFQGKPVLPLDELIAAGRWSPFLYQLSDTLLSGMLIGGGSQPVHVLIKFLTTRKLTDQEQARRTPSMGRSEECRVVGSTTEPATAVAQAAVTPSLLSDSSNNTKHAWQPIIYRGGVKPDTLEGVHRRSMEPNLIVVHHTAMHSQLGFHAIVDEFLVTKRWLTGYHAVVMPDGQIKPFCRWDRTGNHALGHNDHTLGIAFHGNFHDSTGRYGNHDGRYGNVSPTPEQLDAGARLVALWRSLYPDITGSASEYLVPHRDLESVSTVCPGSRFPVSRLRETADAFYGAWHHDSNALANLAQFRQQPFIYSRHVSVTHDDRAVQSRINTKPPVAGGH